MILLSSEDSDRLFRLTHSLQSGDVAVEHEVELKTLSQISVATSSTLIFLAG